MWKRDWREWLGEAVRKGKRGKIEEVNARAKNNKDLLFRVRC